MRQDAVRRLAQDIEPTAIVLGHGNSTWLVLWQTKLNRR